MKTLDMTEKTKDEDYESRKKEALDFLQRVRAIREKKRRLVSGAVCKEGEL